MSPGYFTSRLIDYFILFYPRLPRVAFPPIRPPPSPHPRRPPPPRREFLTQRCAGISFYRRIAFLVRDTSRSRDLRALRSDYGKCSRDGSHREIRAKPERSLNTEGASLIFIFLSLLCEYLTSADLASLEKLSYIRTLAARANLLSRKLSDLIILTELHLILNPGVDCLGNWSDKKVVFEQILIF